MKAVVLAAGKGARLDPLTAKMPKHLLPVAGAPLIEHVLISLQKAGVDEVLIIVHHMKENIQSFLGDGSRLGLRIAYIDQGGILGTGHALTLAERFVEAAAGGNAKKELFLVAYGDLAVHPDVPRHLISSHQPGTCGTVLGVDMKDSSEYGAMEINSGCLSRIVEKPQGRDPGTINGGMYLLSPEIFDFTRKTPKSERGEFELTTSLNMALDAGLSFGVHRVGSGGWIDVGRPWNLLEANKMLMDANINEIKLEGTVCLESRRLISGNVVIESGAELLPGAYIEGPAWISSGCSVGPNCYIRPYTYLCRGVKVGNACEVKGSILMEGVHVGHLSYIGDSVIGANSNLGAGTITANLRFDDMPVRVRVGERVMDSGRRKLGAFLGDGVKTGINVSLYPGVKVGYGSWIGPHVPLCSDVPPNTLVTAKVDLLMRQRR